MSYRDGLPSSCTPLLERNTTGPYLDTARQADSYESASACSGYARRVRPALLLLAVFAAATVTACASAGGRTPIVFGITGGNALAYRVTIQPNGSVRVSRGWRVRKQILPAQVRHLRGEIQNAHLRTRMCTGALPDFATNYIRLGGRTVKMHGDCEARFTRVFDDLAAAVKLRVKR